MAGRSFGGTSDCRNSASTSDASAKREFHSASSFLIPACSVRMFGTAATICSMSFSLELHALSTLDSLRCSVCKVVSVACNISIRG